ncbi:HAD family hydrolase [Flavobacterium silvaticum]|uniref:HAD family phosphatase n=1 Tax=Flavobacterium silvaticum TaxID=1852020 RepID=A0A972FTC9_9FLAO|nr:HAD family phosphatase [Flavobacterium silvaticum]NMH28133.1 HAD family phosphatase [Flavobacterium silvaticum]
MKNIIKPKAVIFDMDGTLVDNIPFHKKAWLTFLAKHNIHLEPEHFNAQNHGTIDEMIKRFFGENLNPKRITELGFEKEQTYRYLYREHISEIEGLTKFLRNLKNQNIKIGLATMGDIPNIDFILDALQIRDYFDGIVGGHMISKGKPDPEIFNTVATLLHVENNDCLVFEDSIGGVRSARSANMCVIGIMTTESSDDLKANGCFRTIKSFVECCDVDFLKSTT